MKQSFKGFTLLEVTFVVIVIAAISLVVLNQYHRSHYAQNIIKIQGSVDLLQNGVQQYYLANCHALTSRGKAYPVSIERDLYPRYLASLDLIRNPFYQLPPQSLQSFSVAVQWSNEQRNWLLTVSATFPEHVSQQELQNIADSTQARVSDHRLLWQRIPGASSIASDIGHSPLSDDLEQFARQAYNAADFNKPGAEEPIEYPCVLLDEKYLLDYDRGLHHD